MNVLLQEKNLAESDNILRAFAFSKKYRSMPFGYRQGNPRILFDSQSRHQRIAQDRFPLQEGSIADKTIPNLIFVSRNSTFATGARVWLPFIRVAHLDPATLAL